MLTQFFRSINWVDVALAALFVRVVFTSVTTGFITEVFKFFGVLIALVVGLHYYAFLAEVTVKKTSLPLTSMKFVIFTALVCAIVFLFKLVRDGVLLLFKVETTHQGFDKYGAGVLGALRGWLLCSVVLFAILLLPHSGVHKHAMSGWGHKVAAQPAVNTYSFVYHRLVGKLFEGQKFNADAMAVVGSGDKV